MFKAPPPDLLDLLNEDDSAQNQPLELKVAKVNNFVREASKSRSKSRPKIAVKNSKPTQQQKKFTPFNLCSEDEDDSKKSGDENPFQSTSTLLMNKEGGLQK